MVKRTDMIECLQAGLRNARTRQSVIANNIANLQTPGYRRYDVEFDQRLADAMNSGRPIDMSELKPEVTQPMSTKVSSNGNDVDMDMEIGQMIKNDALYKTYVRILAKLYQQMELATQTK